MIELIGYARILVFVVFGVVFAVLWVQARRARAEEIRLEAQRKLLDEHPLLPLLIVGGLYLTLYLFGGRRIRK